MIKTKLPLENSPLVHCITNTVTSEYVANSLHACGAKPIMLEYEAEIDQAVTIIDALLINIGMLSVNKEIAMKQAMREASANKKPVVVDIVGIGVSKHRQELTLELLKLHPSVVKGNVSELRNLCGLTTTARGVDSNSKDNEDNAIKELATAMKEFVKQYPQTTFLATGEVDIVVDKENCILLKNGVPYLDKFSGSGDAVGALICALLPHHASPLEAVCEAVSYFNIAGEQANAKDGIGSFRIDLLNKLEKVQNTEWVSQVKGERL